MGRPSFVYIPCWDVIGFKTSSSPVSFFFLATRNVVSTVAYETVNTDGRSGSAIWWHSCTIFIILCLYLCLYPYFRLSLNKCTMCKFIDMFRTPETMVRKIPSRNTARDNKGAAEGLQARERCGQISFRTAHSRRVRKLPTV